MFRRWIIRSFFIALLLLFVGGWVVSYKYNGEIIYRGRYFWYLGIDRGEIHLWWAEPVVRSWGKDNEGWDYGVEPISAELDLQFVPRFASPYCLGFSATIADDDKMVSIPF